MYEYISIHEINGRLKAVFNESKEDKNWDLDKYISWRKNHVILDFNSQDDLKKCRAYAIRKHYNSDNGKIPHDQALRNGVEVDCIRIRRSSATMTNWSSQDKSNKSPNTLYAYFQTPNR